MRQMLVLRPEPGASATLARASQLGIEAIAVPLFEVECIAWTAPDSKNFDGLLLTSANAVRCARRGLKSLGALPAYAVGDATAEEAREAGLEIAATGDAGVDSLLDCIEAKLRFLHLCGEHRRAPDEQRHQITPLPVYRSKPIQGRDLSPSKNAVALVHSPRAGRRFAELAKDRHSTIVAAISSAAADAVGSGWESVEVAPQPNDEALLALAARLCKKPVPQ